MRCNACARSLLIGNEEVFQIPTAQLTALLSSQHPLALQKRAAAAESKLESMTTQHELGKVCA